MKGAKPTEIGLLKLKIIEGTLYRDTETFGHMDPFVELEHRGIKYKTQVKKDAGKKPKWEEVLEVNGIESIEDTVKLTCYDEDLMMDECVGEAEFKIAELISRQVVNLLY